jgi:hypothetical protein
VPSARASETELPSIMGTAAVSFWKRSPEDE